MSNDGEGTVLQLESSSNLSQLWCGPYDTNSNRHLLHGFGKVFLNSYVYFP